MTTADFCKPTHKHMDGERGLWGKLRAPSKCRQAGTPWLAPLGLCLALACPTAVAEMADWDEDDNERISQEEFWNFAEGTGLYSHMDANDDGMLNREEFAVTGGNFAMVDQNGNNYLEEEEAYPALHQLYDVDDDGRWGADEWQQFMSKDWF